MTRCSTEGLFSSCATPDSRVPQGCEFFRLDKVALAQFQLAQHLVEGVGQ